jgi:glycosyltransferase involved in cell wall biosynthesis
VRIQWVPREWRSPLSSSACRHVHSRAATVVRLLNACWLLRGASGFDVVMMNRDLLPEIRIGFLEPLLAKRNPRLIFDFDDAIHLTLRGAKLRKILPHFAWITAGNEYLAQFARQLHQNVSVWPSVVDTGYYVPTGARKPGPIRIGWSGSRQPMRDYLPLIKTSLVELARQIEFEFIVISNEPPGLDWPGVRSRFLPWNPATEAQDLQEIDIGIMPLRDAPFERGKCGMKAILYMSAGIPAVVSPVGANQEIVIDSKTGFHCRTEAEWVKSLRRLAQDQELRRTLGQAARAHVEARYSQQYLLPKMVDVFTKVATIKGDRWS